MITPPPLRAHESTIAIVAPAGPFNRWDLFRGLAWLQTRYRLRIDARILERTGYLAGDDATRAIVAADALRDPDVEAIVCARGGYGVTRIMDALPFREWRERPQWLVGFSDITALHMLANGHGVASIHGPNVTGLGRAISASEREALITILEGRAPPPWRGLGVVWPGRRVEGTLFGGNLTLTMTLAAAGKLVVPEGSILMLEDVSERPYRIDRMLTSLALGGHLQRAAAIVFGSFTECEPGPDGVDVMSVLAERTRSLGVPVVSGAPFGHGTINQPFILGSRATLDRGHLTFHSP